MVIFKLIHCIGEYNILPLYEFLIASKNGKFEKIKTKATAKLYRSPDSEQYARSTVNLHHTHFKRMFNILIALNLNIIFR